MVIAWAGPLLAAWAAPRLQVIESFGIPDQAGQNPSAGLLQASDGTLYGTTHAGGLGGAGTLFKIAPGGSDYKVLHHFGLGQDGTWPDGNLVEGTNGILYGTTFAGGSNNFGTIFAIAKDGSGYTNLFSFEPPGSVGQCQAALTSASDGLLYGTTSAGGSNNLGTVFRFNPVAGDFAFLYEFGIVATDGSNPVASLVEGTNGFLYGTTSEGGIYNGGVVFRLHKTGGNYAVLHHFTAAGGDGTNPQAGLLQASDGLLYGTTVEGGGINAGSVFRLDPEGNGYQIVHRFAGADGRNPVAPLIEGKDGLLYGTTYLGGSNNIGTVFRLSRDGTNYTTLRQFSRTSGDGQEPAAPLLQSRDGVLIGTTYTGGSRDLGTLFQLDPTSGDYSIIRNFDGSGGGASYPQGLVRGTNHWLFGLTAGGGTNNMGSVFKIKDDGTGLAFLHFFSGGQLDGAAPVGNPVLASDGFLYGVTTGGGLSNAGAIFKLAQDGSAYQVLYILGTTNGDAVSPKAGLMEASNGALYGTTWAGGSTGNGAVFTLNKAGTGYALLHSFTGGDGAGPWAPLVEGPDGALYGTTYYGGSKTLGVIFKLDKNGDNYQVIHDCVGINPPPPLSPDYLAYPASGLLNGGDGSLYGCTASAVFRINPDGTGCLRLHTLKMSEGNSLHANLVEGLDGDLYGTAYGGGTGNGTVFRVSKDAATFAVVYDFSGFDGRDPFAPLLVGQDGAFYGTTETGGALASGVVFRLLPPQAPEMLGVQIPNNSLQVIFSGTSGLQYQLFHSADPTHWALLTTVSMPPSGISTNLIPPPLDASGFYRAAWVP